MLDFMEFSYEFMKSILLVITGQVMKFYYLEYQYLFNFILGIQSQRILKIMQESDHFNQAIIMKEVLKIIK